VGHPGRHSHEAAGRHCDPLAVAPDLERQLALENVEGIGVLVVNMRAGDLFAS
jgi:hypothetical protein